MKRYGPGSLSYSNPQSNFGISVKKIYTPEEEEMLERYADDANYGKLRRIYEKMPPTDMTLV